MKLEKVLGKVSKITQKNTTVRPLRGAMFSLTDFATGTKLLNFDPSLFLNHSIDPQPISELFNQFFGGLAVIANINGRGSVVDHIAPGSLDAEMKPYYNGTMDKTDMYFKYQTDQKIKASVPGLVQLNVNFGIGNTYHMQMAYTNIGIIGWRNDKNIDISNNFAVKLSSFDHYRLAKWKSKYGDNLRLVQINKAYVFEAIYFETSQLNQIR